MEERYRARMAELHARLRVRLETVRDRLAEVGAASSSRDGMVTVTVDGRGRVVGLELHPRVFRTLPAADLAYTILATAHDAAGHAAHRAHQLVSEELTS